MLISDLFVLFLHVPSFKPVLSFSDIILIIRTKISPSLKAIPVLIKFVHLFNSTFWITYVGNWFLLCKSSISFEHCFKYFKEVSLIYVVRLRWNVIVKRQRRIKSLPLYWVNESFVSILNFQPYFFVRLCDTLTQFIWMVLQSKPFIGLFYFIVSSLIRQVV